MQLLKGVNSSERGQLLILDRSARVEQDGGHGAAEPNRVCGGGLSRDGAGPWGSRWQRRDRRRGMAAEECVMNQELTLSISRAHCTGVYTGFDVGAGSALEYK